VIVISTLHVDENSLMRCIILLDVDLVAEIIRTEQLKKTETYTTIVKCGIGEFRVTTTGQETLLPGLSPVSHLRCTIITRRSVGDIHHIGLSDVIDDVIMINPPALQSRDCDMCLSVSLSVCSQAVETSRPVR